MEEEEKNKKENEVAEGRVLREVWWWLKISLVMMKDKFGDDKERFGDDYR